MSFLKKLGSIILKATEIVTGLAPVIEAAVPGEAGIVRTVSKDLTQIAQVVQEVEVMGQALDQPGAQKLKAAAPLVAQIVLQSSLLADHAIANPTLFQQGCTELAGAVADILNSLKADVTTVSKT